MDYKLGNSKYLNEHGETEKICCPKCNNKVKLSVFSNFEARAIAKLPLIKTSNVYFLVCPKCSAVYGVDANNAKAFKNGSKFAIMQGDLKELEEYIV